MSTVDSLVHDPMSVSDDDLNRLMAESDDGESAGDDQDEQAEVPESEAKEEPKAEAKKDAEEPEPAKEPEQQPSVLTRDGKNQIPYSVLESERRAAREAKQATVAAQQLADQERAQRQILERQIAELTSAKATLDSGKAAKPVDQIIDADQIEALREDAPELAAVLSSLTERLKAQQAEIDANKQATERSQRELQDERSSRAQEQVERAIGNIPKLVYVRSENPEAFNAVVEIDDWARTQPAFKSMSLEERFTKSIAMYEAAHGVIDLPGSVAKPEPVKDVSAAAAAAIAKATRTTVPNTLSDMPGGSLPAKSDAETLGAMSAIDLQQKMLGMDDKAIEKLLASLPS